MTTTTLTAMPYAQAKVLIMDNGNIVLRSYYTGVATLTAEGWLTIHGLYSTTTRKHIGAFMREFTGMEYQTAKQIYTDGYQLNIHTGEVVPL